MNRDRDYSAGIVHRVSGWVQGVGFRPYIYRLARELNLAGWIQNDTRGVAILVQGTADALTEFERRLRGPHPHPIRTDRIESAPAPASTAIEKTFSIRPSNRDGPATARVLPDLATCPECLRELFDPHDRRYVYPFINCTHCGPRFSIIERLPYDRPHTTMKGFAMCDACRAEYEDPGNRRFHAQPNACPVCGPRIWTATPSGERLAENHQALLDVAAAIRRGDIVAFKGLGGFHLIADARNEDAIRELRRRKRREEKPLAMMFPSLSSIEAACSVDEIERELLLSAAAPIVLLRQKNAAAVSSLVAPGNPYWGVMLPYTPLHHLLLRELDAPVIATSGNLSDEPICIDNADALERLAGIADLFLLHNRPIARQMDDSIARSMAGRELLLRRARGYAPYSLDLGAPTEHPDILAVGGHLKNTFSLCRAGEAIVSQHIGDLDTYEARQAFERSIDTLTDLYDIRPEILVCDLHPDYPSTRYARRASQNVVAVQHHHAHIAAVMAEQGLTGPVLGVAWDGTGYGADGSVWGGEFLLADRSSFRRVAHFRTFPLPGGDRAVLEPRRSALGILFEMFGADGARDAAQRAHLDFTSDEQEQLPRLLKRRVHAPLTSSAGRLFDAASALLGLRMVNRYEGQAAMELEFLAATSSETQAFEYGLTQDERGEWIIDWEPLFQRLLREKENACSAAFLAAGFHHTLVEAMRAVVLRMSLKTVVLSGGCFQNRYLTELAVRRLRENGLDVYWHREIPPNDACIALGQAVIARQRVQGSGFRS